MAGLGGGIGRFARKKQQLSQQDANASSSASDSRHHGEEERPTDNTGTEFDTDTATTLATVKNGNATAKDAATAGNDLFDDRPETPFNSFADDEFGPPAKTGGGAFSAIDQMFDAMDEDDHNDADGRNDRLEGMFVETTPAANDGDNNLESNFSEQGLFDCDNFRGFNAFDDASPYDVEKQLQLLDPQVGNGHDYADRTNGTEVNSPNQVSTTSATAAAADIGRTGLVKGGGIGLFAKKHAYEPAPALAALTAATSTNDPRESPPPPERINAEVDFSARNSMKELSSVADLSRFDTDLVSKNGETTILAMNPPPPEASVVDPGPGSDHGGVEVPKSIPMSSIDDVDDDLTIGTTGVEGVDLFTHRENGNAARGNERESSDPKTSPYFSNSLNSQPVVQTDEYTTGTTNVTDASKSTSVHGGGEIMLSNHPSSSAPRVSFSPPPGPSALRTGQINQNQAACFLPQGRNMEGSAESDDNSIVIPGVPASVANNMNAEGRGAISGATAGVSVSQYDSTNRNSRSYNMETSAEGRVGPSRPKSQKSSQASTKTATTQSALDRTSTTINYRDIDDFAGRTEKVKFTSRDPNGSNSFKKSRVTIGATSANSESMANKASTSTAITPDHRQLDAQDSGSTPYSHGVNGNNGGTITPTPHKAPAPTPEAPIPTTTPITDFQSMTMEEEAPSEILRGRPRSQTIYSPTPSTIAESITPKACNMNPTSSNQGFDELLSEFVTYIQEGADIFEKGQSDLLELEVDLSHAFAAVLRYKDEYTSLLSEIDRVQTTSESIISEISRS